MKAPTNLKLISLAIAASVSGIANTAVAEGLEEIIVTAQKREQNALEVPLSVTSVSKELVSNIFDGGADVRALSGRVPGLYVESSNGRVAPRFYIRGLGNTDFDLAASQPVSVIMDGVVKENVILKSFPIFDVANVEVLRGPQGTLFGRNTTAGIVKFDSAKPSQEADAYVDVSYGQLGTSKVEAALGGRLFSDSLSGRISVLKQRRDDWINNGYTNESDVMGGFSDDAIRAQLLWAPSDSFDVLASIHSRELDGSAAMFRANIFDKGSNELNGNYDRDTVWYDSPHNNPQSYSNDGASVTFNIGLGETELTLISAIEKADGSSLGDIDGGYGCGFCGMDTGPGFIPFDSTTEDKLSGLKQFTQEARLAGDLGDSIKWQAGLYYFDSGFDITTNPFFVPATKVRHENTLSAVFGQVEYHLSDNLNVVAGARFTSDEKRFFGPGGIKDEASDERPSGDLSVNYSLGDHQVVYARVANGFRGPSIQGRDMAFSGTYSIADSETVSSVEVGYKAEFNDSVRINAAIFSYTVSDMQFTAVGGDGNNVRLLNAEEGNVKGAEIDLTVVLTDNLVATLGAAYNDTEINDKDLLVNACGNFGSFLCTVEDPIVNGFASIHGNPFPNAPETTANFTLSYTVPVASGEIFAFTDWNYQGATNMFLYESAEFKTDGQFEGGASIGYRANDNWEVSLFGRNITNEHNVQGAIDFNNLTGFVNEPRVFGIQGRYSL